MVIDKPAGITSAGVVARIKRMFRGRKVGHTGTLDPFATGLMVCCVGRATKLAQFFLHGPKTYLATLCLGVETDTQDATGEVTTRGDATGLSAPDVSAALARFKGDIMQTPPVFSALKHRGTPLYKLARSGRPVQKPPRRVHISALEVRQMALPEVQFSVSCSAGTYIRTLCADVGRELGCGGHLKVLRRVNSCGFDITESISLEYAERLAASSEISRHMIPMADALRHIPAHVADQGLAGHIVHGRQLTRQDIPGLPEVAPRNYVKIVDMHHHLLAVLQANEQGDGLKYCCVFPGDTD